MKRKNEAEGISTSPESPRKSAHIWYDPRPLASSNELVPMFACSYTKGTTYDIRVPALQALVSSLISEGYALSLCPEAKFHLVTPATAIGGNPDLYIEPEIESVGPVLDDESQL